jgi:hypothetical protein
MTMGPIRRTLSMSPDVDRMLVDHVARTPGASLSSTVNAAVVDYIEASAMRAYERWDQDARPDERATIAAFDDQP